MTRRFVTVLLVCALVAASGCTKSHVQKVARFQPVAGDESLVRTAPRTGVYKIKWTRGSSEDLKTLPGTARLIYQGESIGFTTAPEGKLTAIAGAQTFPVQGLPDDVRYCVWYRHTEEKTEFGEAMDEAGEVAKGAAVIAGAAALIGGLVVLKAAVESDDDDCDACDKCD